MDVSVTELRANLKAMLERVKAGETLTITERGKPVAKLAPATADDRLADLIARGIVSPAKRPKRPLAEHGAPLDIEFPSGKTLTDYVLEQRGQ
jgi:prevent-host-death family protein